MTPEDLAVIRTWLQRIDNGRNCYPATVGKTWRRQHGSGWVVGRYEMDSEGYLVDRWYCPVVIPVGAALEEQDGLWVGRIGGFTMAAASWPWVWRELWRAAKSQPLRRAC